MYCYEIARFVFVSDLVTFEVILMMCDECNVQIDNIIWKEKKVVLEYKDFVNNKWNRN